MSSSHFAAVASVVTGLVVFTSSLGGCDEGRGPSESGVGPTEVTSAEVQARVGDLVIADSSVFGGVEGDVSENRSARGQVRVRMTIVNEGETEDTLLSASTPVASEVSLLDADEKPTDEGIEVPAGSTTILDDGGPYLQLEQAEGDLGVGDTVQLVLEFAEAGTVSLDVPVGSESFGEGEQGSGTPPSGATSSPTPTSSPS
jgi:copper(I)-binding protein